MGDKYNKLFWNIYLKIYNKHPNWSHKRIREVTMEFLKKNTEQNDLEDEYGENK